MKPTVFVVLLLCLFLSFSFTLAQSAPEFVPGECPFIVSDEYNVECGFLYVPEDRADATSDLIALAVAIVRSPNPDKAPDPIIYLEGGPGGSAISGISSWLNTPFLQNRDVILIDQRGTGYSVPFLGCYVDEEEAEDNLAYARLCHEDLIAQGIRLSAYTSAENAADIADLRVALGYEQVNLYGISYGTRLALTIMRDHPQGIRSVVLDSVYPPDAMGQNEQAFNFYLALSQMFADCSASPACNAAYPELENTLFDFVDAANENPIDLEGEDFYGDDLLSMLFDALYDTRVIPYLPALIAQTAAGDDALLLALLYGELGYEDYEEEAEVLFDPAYVMYVELLMDYLDFDDEDELFEYFYEISDDAYYEIQEEFLYEVMSDEDFDELFMLYFSYDDIDALYDDLDAMNEDELVELYDELIVYLIEGGKDVSDSDGMFYSVECYEEVAFNSLSSAEAFGADVPEQVQIMTLTELEVEFEICALWAVNPPNAIETLPVQSDIPTLVFSGNYDPITPPVWGELATQSLSVANHYEFPGVGHGVVDGGVCPLQMALAFINAPQNEPDASCIAEMGAPTFIILD